MGIRLRIRGKFAAGTLFEGQVWFSLLICRLGYPRLVRIPQMDFRGGSFSPLGLVWPSMSRRAIRQLLSQRSKAKIGFEFA